MNKTELILRDKFYPLFIFIFPATQLNAGQHLK